MIKLQGYQIIAVVQRPNLDSYFTYWANVPESEINPAILDKLAFGFRQGIDDNHNSGKPSFINTKSRALFYLSGGDDAVRVDYYAVPNDAMLEFTKAVKAYEDEKTGDSFYFWYYATTEISPSYYGNKSELLTDEFYDTLMRKGGL